MNRLRNRSTSGILLLNIVICVRSPLKTSRRSCLRWPTSSGNNARYGATKDHSSSLTSEGQGLRMVDIAAFYHLSMSRLSQALAGEIRREPVHAEGEREL